MSRGPSVPFLLVTHGASLSPSCFCYTAIAFVLAAHLLFASKHPFRAQLVSLSIYLGAVLVLQPTLLFNIGDSIGMDLDEGEATAAMPLDLPVLVRLDTLGNKVPQAWAWAAAAASTLMTLLSLAMLDRRPRAPSSYQCVAANSLMTALAGFAASAVMASHTSTEIDNISEATALSPVMFAMLVGVAFFSLTAQILQDLAFQYIGACQIGLISFLQVSMDCREGGKPRIQYLHILLTAPPPSSLTLLSASFVDRARLHLSRHCSRPALSRWRSSDICQHVCTTAMDRDGDCKGLGFPASGP